MPAEKRGPGPEEKEIPVSILKIEQKNEMLWRASRPAKREAFPPCIRNIIDTGRSMEKGRYRMASILAAFLGQSGWAKEEARSLWSEASGVEERIFANWFGRMHCPKCETLKRGSQGYPHPGVADLGICQPDLLCPQIRGPVEYACRILSDEDRSRGTLHKIKTYFRVRVFDWTRGVESDLKLSEKEYHELCLLLASQEEQKKNKSMIMTWTRARGRLRPRFFLKENEGPRRQVLSDLL